MTRKYFGTDGIRGESGVGIMSPDSVLKLGWAAGKVLAAQHESKLVLIGKDTRISGYMYESLLEAGLSAAGVHTRLLGPMPTPGVAYLTRTLRASAGIVISASHNPFYDNGVKFFSSCGEKLPDSVELEIEAQMDCAIQTVASDQLGKAMRIDDARGRYIEFCKSCLPTRTSMHGLKVVVDCAHGASYHSAPEVFSELGAEVIAMGVSPNGLNINLERGATSPEALAVRVVEEKADLGIALDGDGDRLIMVDHKGEIVDGDAILYLIATDQHKSGSLQGGVVGTLMTNLGMELGLKEKNIPFERANVGDRYVMEILKKNNWKLGGESSGHIICLEHTTTGDGIIAALQVLHILVKSGKTLNEIKQHMVIYPQTLINVRHGGDMDLNAKSVQAAVKQVEDQLGSNGRVLLRASGTEPLIRVMVEGRDKAEVAECAQRIADTLSTIARPS